MNGSIELFIAAYNVANFQWDVKYCSLRLTVELEQKENTFTISSS